MPRLIATQYNKLPANIIGPPEVAAGRVLSFSDEEAAQLLAIGGWQVFAPSTETAPLLDRMARPSVRKSVTKTVTAAAQEAPDGCDHTG